MGVLSLMNKLGLTRVNNRHPVRVKSGTAAASPWAADRYRAGKKRKKRKELAAGLPGRRNITGDFGQDWPGNDWGCRVARLNGLPSGSASTVMRIVG